MSNAYKKEMLNVLREIAGTLSRLEAAVAVGYQDVHHRLAVLETDAPRVERRLLDVESKVAK